MKISLRKLRCLIKEAMRDTWTGLGTDTPILHRHEPKRRSKPAARRAAELARERKRDDAGRLWDAADNSDRAKFIRNELDGFEVDSRAKFVDMSWEELCDAIGPSEVDYIAKRVDDWWGLE